MKFKTFLIASALSVGFSASAATKDEQSGIKQIEDIRRSFFMPVATNSLCPEEYRVSAEKFAAFRSNALMYLDYLQASVDLSAKPQFESARTEITGNDIPATFLAKATKIYRKYPPAEAQSLFCASLNRMFDGEIIELLMRGEQKRRGE
ncbi:hypothetical protein [Duganella vulcania]|uniref:Uncharacterized protein n=1 Tax=Duganella vulcania TaxID=2692166 RepID=A0A845GHJ4_9BURK|nr:hypothetical protein [Duganella vulcania]MYM94053.1 hypothetical protein [Duganella vulcania]